MQKLINKHIVYILFFNACIIQYITYTFKLQLLKFLPYIIYTILLNLELKTNVLSVVVGNRVMISLVMVI